MRGRKVHGVMERGGRMRYWILKGDNDEVDGQK